jgi:ribosomal protein S18 acetylase RimI-like enzyme
VEDADVVATLFSEFNAILGSDGLRGEISFAPQFVDVTGAQMARRMKSMAGIEYVLIAEEGGDPTGLCCLRLIPYIGQDVPYAEVTQLFVRPGSQRNGVGKALLREAESRAKADGATCMHIITSNDNTNAQAFYRAQGYITEMMVFDKYFDTEEAHA